MSLRNNKKPLPYFFTVIFMVKIVLYILDVLLDVPFKVYVSWVYHEVPTT